MWCEKAVLVGGDGVIGVAVSMGGAVGHFAALSLCYFLMHVAIEAHWAAPPPSELLQGSHWMVGAHWWVPPPSELRQGSHC